MRRAAVLLLLAAACGGEAVPAASTVTVTDGVRVVENAGTAAARSGWMLSRRPVFRTGWADDEPTFELVRDGFIRPDGGVVVADVNGERIYAFGPAGDLEYTAGRTGDGPGEFRSLQSIVGGGADTVFAQDSYGSLTTFAGAEPVRTEVVDWRWRVGRSILELEDRLASGDLVLAPGAFSPLPSTGWARAPVLRLAPDAASADTLVLVDHVEQRELDDRNPIRYWAWARVAAGRIVYVRNDSAEIRWFDMEGQLRQITRWDHAYREADEASWAAYESATRSRGPGPELSSDRFERMLAEQREDFRGRLPVLRAMYVDRTGHVWLGKYTWAGRPTNRYDIVSPEGVWLGGIDVPEGLLVLDITAEHLLAVEEDELDIQAVTLYEIVKPRRTP